MTLTLSTDRPLVPAAQESSRYLHVAFAAPAAPARGERRPLTVAFVLDRSGSMGGEKIELAKRAIAAALDMLRPDDTFAIVTYDDRIDVVVPATLATLEAREGAKRGLDAVDARGTTDLSTGWLTGCDQIADAASDDTIARTLLLSDGLANRGITSATELAARAADLRRAHIVTSTFGVGRDFDEPLMAAMAHAGGGNFYFIERAVQIRDMLTSELGEALEVVSRGAVVELELPEGVEAELLHQFRFTRTGSRLRIELDDLVSNQQVSLIVKVRVPQGAIGSVLRVRASASSADDTISGAADLTWTYADAEADEKGPRDMHVTRLAAGIEAARTRHEMLELNRAGNFAGASSLASAGAALLSRLAPDDRQVRGVLASLQADIPHVAAQMDPLLMKRMHSSSSSARKMRDAEGRARRDTQRMELQAREADGHLFVEVPGCGPFLLATGCPLTLADDRFELLGRPFVFLPQAPPAFLRSAAAPVDFSLDDIRQQVRAPMAGLLGMDVLQHYFWTLDMGRGVMTLSTERLDAPGSAVPFNTFAGVPLVSVHIDGRSADAFVDTGAWLSYMPASEAAGASPVDTRHDFIVSPAPMHFTTAVYEKTLTLAGAELTGQFGVLPSEVPLPQAAKRRWILGAGLLSRRPLSFDPNGVMTFGHEP